MCIYIYIYSYRSGWKGGGCYRGWLALRDIFGKRTHVHMTGAQDAHMGAKSVAISSETDTP